MSSTQPPKRDNKDFITTAIRSAMATEATAQAIVRAKLVDSPLSVFYIACKRSCWWVKVSIFFLKATLSCQTNASVSKNEKWCGLWTIANTGESWFGCQWDDRQIYLETAILANFSTNDSPGEALLVISKETVGNSWDISSAILDHKYHQNHSNRSSEWRQHLQQKWLIQYVNGWVDWLFYWHQHSGSVHHNSEIRSRKNVWKAHIRMLSVANFGFIPFVHIR